MRTLCLSENVFPLPKRQPDGISALFHAFWPGLSLSLPAESGDPFLCHGGLFFCGGDVMTCSGWNAFQMLRFAVQTQKTLKDSVFFLAFPLRQASVGRCWNATLFYGKAKKCCSCLLRIENMTSVLASWFFFPRFFFRSRLKQLWKSKFHEWSLPALHPELKSVFTTSRLWKTKAKWPWEIMRWTKKWLRPGHIFFNAGKA